MTRKKASGNATKKAPKKEKKKQSQQTPESGAPLMAPPTTFMAPQTSNFNPWAMCQMSYQQPQSQCFMPFMQSAPNSVMPSLQFGGPSQQPIPNAAMQLAPSIFPQAIGMPGEMQFMGQQHMNPYYCQQFIPQPFVPNMCPPTPYLPSTSMCSGLAASPQKIKKQKEPSSSSSEQDVEEESTDEDEDDDDDDDDVAEIVDGSAKQCGAIYKPGKSKPDDVDNEGQSLSEKEAAGNSKSNSRKGSLNKKTMSNLRSQAAAFWKTKRENGKKNVSTKRATSASPKKPSKPKTQSTVKKEYFSDDEDKDDDFEDRKPKGTKKK